MNPFSSQKRHSRNIVLVILSLTVGLVACKNLPTTQQSDTDATLRIWWSEGYYPEETQAMRDAVTQWEQTSKIKTEITFYSEKDLIQQSESAVAAGKPPDVLYGYSIDLVLAPRLAWDNKLVDVSDVIEPIKNLYSPDALKSVNYFNNRDKKRSYYAIPISQQTTHIHYWKNLIQEAGLSPADIPKTWVDFWNFWGTVQNTLRQKGEDKIFGIGMPMSTAATDTSYQFEQFLEAYNVELVNEAGELQTSNPQVRQGIIQALTDYTDLYKKGYVPNAQPNSTNTDKLDAKEWSDPDNNIAFLSNLTVMTPNPSLSIPGSQRQDEDTYFKKMGTVLWPAKPDGKPMVSVVSVKQVVIFANSSKVKEAKAFLSYLTQPQILEGYIKGSQGRFFPVMPQLLKNAFWNDPKDPHFSVAIQQFQSTRPFYFVRNPAYSQVQSKNVWGTAIKSVIAEGGVSPEVAADKAIEEITRIFSEWK